MPTFATLADLRTLVTACHQRPLRADAQQVVFGVLLFLTQCSSRLEGNRQLTEPKSWTTL